MMNIERYEHGGHILSDFQTAARLYQQQGNQELYRRALNRISQLR